MKYTVIFQSVYIGLFIINYYRVGELHICCCRLFTARNPTAQQLCWCAAQNGLISQKKTVKRYFSWVIFAVGLMYQLTKVQDNRSFSFNVCSDVFLVKVLSFPKPNKKMEPKQKQSATGNKQNKVSTWYLNPTLLGESPLYACPPIPLSSTDFTFLFICNVKEICKQHSLDGRRPMEKNSQKTYTVFIAKLVFLPCGPT